MSESKIDYEAAEDYQRRIAQAEGAMAEHGGYRPNDPDWNNDYSIQAAWFTAVVDAFPDDFEKYSKTEEYQARLAELETADNKAGVLRAMSNVISRLTRDNIMNYVEYRMEQRRKEAEAQWEAEERGTQNNEG